MNLDQAKTDIVEWITTFVEVPHPSLGDWSPCPYARRARLDNRIDIQAGTSNVYQDLKQVDVKDWDVVMLVYDPKNHTAEDFDQQIQQANQDMLVPNNTIALGDHPDEVENINGVIMNQGKWALVFVQKLDELNTKARAIGKIGFYDTWPEEYLDDLFLHRKDPR